MKKNLFFLLILFIISCDENDNIIGSETIPIGIEQTIDATSYIDWNYYKLTDTTLQKVIFYYGDPDNSLLWDIAFQRNHIKTNSGTSGIGNAGAYVDSINTWDGSEFNNFNPQYIDIANFEFFVDTLVNTFYDTYTHTFTEGSSNPSLDTWGLIDTLNNYTMNITNNKFVIRSANGENFYKFWVYDYYNEYNESGNVSLIYNEIDVLED